MTDPEQLLCAECGFPLGTADAEFLVATDAGPVHRECFEGPVPPGSEVELDELEMAAENERRQDHGEPPITLIDWKDAGDLPDDADPEGQKRAYEEMLGIQVVEGRVCADDRSARKVARAIKDDLERPLDPDRSF